MMMCRFSIPAANSHSRWPMSSDFTTTRAALRAAGHSQTIKPLSLSGTLPGGFSIDDFQIDQQAGTVSCPAGYQTKITASGQASFARWCQCCPLRQRCTTAGPAVAVAVRLTRPASTT
jgi:hypothetical protein